MNSKDIVPRQWQKTALDAWRTSMRGVITAVTGAGKTTFALLCVQEFLRNHPDGMVLIIVPTIPLLDQWYLALVDDFGIDQTDVGIVAAGRKKWQNHKFVIAVINSARNLSSLIAEANSTFLIVDECHRAGSKENATVLSGNFIATLGLSATPERQYDDGFDKFVKPALGEVIFEYNYNQAFYDGVIVPFQLVNIQFALTSSEQREYNDLTRKLAVMMSKGNDFQKHIEAILRKRARISWNSPLRVPLAAKIAIQHRKERMIIFHESIQHADGIYNILLDRGIHATIYHTHLHTVVRQQNLRLYRNGYYSCIICCRALDEGFNVPNTSIGIVASSTSSIRQRIQRLGRVLRQVAGKQEATIYTLHATPPETERLLAESKRLEGISQVKWLSAEVRSNG